MSLITKLLSPYCILWRPCHNSNQEHASTSPSASQPDRLLKARPAPFPSTAHKSTTAAAVTRALYWNGWLVSVPLSHHLCKTRVHTDKHTIIQTVRIYEELVI